MVIDVVFWSLHHDLFPANLFNKITECTRIKMQERMPSDKEILSQEGHFNPHKASDKYISSLS